MKRRQVLIISVVALLPGCELVKDYAPAFGRKLKAIEPAKVAEAIKQSADAVARTSEIVTSVATIRDDYVLFREQVRPHLELLDAPDRAIVESVNADLIRLYELAKGVTERRAGLTLVVDSVEAFTLLNTVTEGINKLVSVGERYQDQVPAEVSAKFSELAGRWAAIHSLVKAIERQANKSVRVQQIKQVLSIFAELLPVAKLIITGLKK